MAPGDDIEVYGFSASGRRKTDLSCPTEAFELELNPAGVAKCHARLHNGNFRVSQFFLCDTYTSTSDMHELSFVPWNKNTIRIAVEEGEAVYIETVLMDYDSASADDPQCVGVVNTERHLLETWRKVRRAADAGG
jgi:hypothetical protein